MLDIIIVPETASREQCRRALRKRQRDLEESLAGEAHDPMMRRWRCRQLAEVAIELGMLELDAERAEPAVQR